MSPNDREMFFKRARISLHQGRLAEAVGMFGALIAECPNDGRYLSYHGLLLGLHDRRVAEGVAACKRAITLASSEPETYLNLVRLYSSTGQPGKAVATLRTAIRNGVRSRAVMGEIDRLSPRRTPLIRSLHRDHLLNRVLARLRSRPPHATRVTVGAGSRFAKVAERG